MIFERIVLTSTALSFALMWEPSFCWRWKSSDASVQEVWPYRSAVKFKRASAVTERSTAKHVPKAATNSEDEDVLIFDGRYFKPNEVPPPPGFMVEHGNWRGSQLYQKPETPVTERPKNHYSGGRFPAITQKFTHENIKEAGTNDTEETSSTDSKSVRVSSSLMELEELHFAEQLELQEIFKDAQPCFTPTDTAGRCIEFRQCFPVVFNVIDGQLRNPGLAKLLYQSSGPCNATLELDFALRKISDDKKYLNAEFYNQTICCPGFKHPPERSQWSNDIRNTRVTNELKHSSPPFTKGPTTISEPISSRTNEVSTAQSQYGNRRLSADESSVEVDEEEDDIEDDEPMEGIVLADETPSNDNSTQAPPTERRGNRDKIEDSTAKSSDVVLAHPGTNLFGSKCRLQRYGMPRGHWPWMVALLISSRHICSGALIDDKHVLTAAHCVDKLEEKDIRKIRIIVGDRVMYSSMDGPHFWRKVSKVMVHLNYNQRTFASDIALLKMNTPVPFSKNIQPISLPDIVPIEGNRANLSKAIVAGWSGADIGQLAFESRAEVETVVDIMDKNECRDVYRGFSLSGIPPNTICTRAANNTCVADSGAPLFVRVHNCWQLVGVMSWGLGCSHFPEVYTDVGRYVSWIRKHVTS